MVAGEQARVTIIRSGTDPCPIDARKAGLEVFFNKPGLKFT
jgi:hypothetical protein